MISWQVIGLVKFCMTHHHKKLVARFSWQQKTFIFEREMLSYKNFSRNLNDETSERKDAIGRLIKNSCNRKQNSQSKRFTFKTRKISRRKIDACLSEEIKSKYATINRTEMENKTKKKRFQSCCMRCRLGKSILLTFSVHIANSKQQCCVLWMLKERKFICDYIMTVRKAQKRIYDLSMLNEFINCGKKMMKFHWIIIVMIFHTWTHSH